MKKILLFLCFIISFVSYSQSFKYNRANIYITFDTTFYLPENWKVTKSPITENHEYYVNIIKSSLDKYPIGILKNIKKVYLLNTFACKGTSIGGTMYEGCIFIKLKDITKDNIEKCLHHEFCHILFHKYEHLFPTSEWKNNTKMVYGGSDSGSGFKSLQKGLNSKEHNPYYFEYGLLSQYASSSLDEDMATFAETFFFEYSKDCIRNNQLLKNKYLLLVSFYKKIDSNIVISI